MAKNTSITLGAHFDDFIAGQVNSGRFGSVSEVVRAALRLLENTESKLETLGYMLAEGEQSGIADYNYDEFMAELDSENGKSQQATSLQRPLSLIECRNVKTDSAPPEKRRQ